MMIVQERLREFLAETKLDGFLVCKRENIFWLTGFDGSFGYVLQKKNGDKILIVDGRYVGKAEKLREKGRDLRSANVECRVSDKEFEVVVFDKDFKDNFGKKVEGVWGFESSISIQKSKDLKKLFPNMKLRVKNNVIENLRRVKTVEEVLRIKKAQEQVDLVLVDFMRKNLRVGVTEKELAFELEMVIREKGRFGLSFDPVVAFGENSAIPHHSYGDRKLKNGENILIDCGAKFEGFCSDITRNFWFGDTDSSDFKEYSEKFDLLLYAQKETLKLYQAGRKVVDADKICREKLGADEKFFTHGLGHGVGIEIHEIPSVSSKSKDQFIENEVVTCEPGVYLKGKFGIRIEDLVLVRKGECEVLSKTEKGLIVV